MKTLKALPRIRVQKKGQRLILVLLTVFLVGYAAAEPIPKIFHRLAQEKPHKADLIQYVWSHFGTLAQYYAEKHGVESIEALHYDAAAAVYSMEVFPGYFQQLSKKVGGKEATHFFKATLYQADFLDEYSSKITSDYLNKPRLLGLLLRSHPRARDHLITDLESNSPEIAQRFIETFADTTAEVRNAIVQYPQFAFFFLETEEEGVEAIRQFGPAVAEVATFYPPGRRREVIRELHRGGRYLLDAYKNSSIVGWQTAIRFPLLYQRLVNSIGVTEALNFLNTNALYLGAHLEDPTDPDWVVPVALQVETLYREGLLSYTYIDAYAFALCLEIGGGKELLSRVGKFMPGYLLYEHYPRHKAFLCRFLNRYGVASLKVLYEFSKQGEQRERLEKVIDKCGSEGLLLVSYAYDQDQVMQFIIDEGFDRGHDYVAKFKFNRYGIPSRNDKRDLVSSEIIKVTTNYFWYGTKPTWAEMGIVAIEVAEYLEKIITMGKGNVVSVGGKIVVSELSHQVFGEYLRSAGEELLKDKIKTIARQIAWRTLKRVVREELEYQKFNQFEPIETSAVAQRMGRNFAKKAAKEAYNIALSEFLKWASSSWR